MMFTKSKIALAAALILGSATASFAQGADEQESLSYYRSPNAQVPAYNEPYQAAPRGFETRGAVAPLIEGRNVGVVQQGNPYGYATEPYGVERQGSAHKGTTDQFWYEGGLPY